MRKYAGMWVAGLWSALAMGGVEPSRAQTVGRPIIEWHFAGEGAFEGVTNIATLKEIWALPESQALRQAASRHWAGQASRRLSHGQTNRELASLIVPLVEDLLRKETKFELRGTSATNNDWVLAIRLGVDRERLWSTNLWKLTSAAEMGSPAITEAGWLALDTRLSQKNYGLKFSSHDGWTVVAGGYGGGVGGEQFLKTLDATSASGSEPLIKARMDLAAMKEVFGIERLAKGPEVKLTVEPRGTGVKTEVSLKFPEDLGIKPEKWNVPVRTIADPLIGFTAIQGIEPLLRKIDWVQNLNLVKVPNQFFMWSRGMTEFSEYWAADVGDPARAVRGLVDTAVPRLMQKFKGNLLGNIEYNTNLDSVAWRDLPVVVPFARPAPAPDSRFLTGGFFPTQESTTNPPPAELLAQIQEKNLIYYDWEITQERLTHIHPLWQLSFIVPDLPLPSDDLPSEKWLRAIAPKLGNTITVATVAGPNELNVVRRSHIGFTALELTLLAHAFDADEPVKKEPRKSAPRPRTGPPGKAPARVAKPVKPASAPKQ